MPGAQLVEAPIMAPGRCISCGASSGPMIDTLVNLHAPVGRVYFCVEGCLVEAALQAGFATPEQAGELRHQVVRQADEIAAVKAELEHERTNKVVSLADARRLLDDLPSDPPTAA